MILTREMPVAEARLDLLDPMNARYTMGGYSALCFGEDHGRKGWRGSLYLHENEIHYKGGPCWYNARTEAWQHNMTEHARMEHELTWEEVMSGSGKPAATADLGVPFTPGWVQFLDDFGDAFVGLFRGFSGRSAA